jgi:hypothetical protein
MPDTACFYEDPDFRTHQHCETVWGNWGDGPRSWQNDKYSSAKVNSGNVAVIYEHGNFTGNYLSLGPGEYRNLRDFGFDDKNSSIRILPDCNDWNRGDLVWQGDCDSRRDIFPNLDENRKKYCNKNKENAYKEKCNPFPDLRNLYNRCAKYSITDDACNERNIINMENKCVQLGFMEQTTKNTIGGNICSDKSINDFLAECRQYIPKYVASESGCTSSGLAEAKRLKKADETAELDRKAAAEEAEKNRKAQEIAAAELVKAQKESDRQRAAETKRLQEESKRQREEAQKKTEAMILSIVDPSALPSDLQQRALKEKSGNNTQMMMIIAIVVVMLLSSSMLMSMLLMII